MYFEIENTPEHIRRSRQVEAKQKRSPKEECPRLILAPFSRPPQVVFDNVLIGTSCERNLEVFNPSKQVQQITLGRSLPPGLVIQLPGEWLVLEPETCYSLTMLWTPRQPTALRETVRFTNESRGRYDVIVVLKSTMTIKGKSNQPKGFKISPGKMKKKSSKKSPVAVYKKKSEIIYNTTKIQKNINVVQTTQHTVLQPSNKINMMNDYSVDSKCPFDSPTSLDFNFDTSEVFSNMRKTNNTNLLQQTYDKSYTSNNKENSIQAQNILKPSNKDNTLGTDIFDNLTFTPLKSLPSKTDKLHKGPKIVVSVNSESDFDDSLDMKTSNKENETHSIITVTTSQPNKWLSVNHTEVDNRGMETPTPVNKKIPNTSSPKELNSPNFSINTEFSRISDLSFFPQRYSTERKGLPKINNDTHDILDDLQINMKLSSDTFTKDSPNTPMEHQYYTESRPPHFFLRDQHPKMRQSLFKEYQQQREIFDRNYLNPGEHNVWNNDLRSDIRSPPRSITPPLQSIPEESGHFSETQVLDKTSKQQVTFTIHDRTFDKDKNSISTRQSWSKKAVIKTEPDLWKVPVSMPRKSLKPKASIKSRESLLSNVTFDGNRSRNITINQVENVYSQSLTVDPFLSSTYFYDEEAVDKFEKEFKRWLNCILTPPADLDSNIEQKIDVGKAWIENRNKEVPVAPTKEQVCSTYHNSHRLASLRRAARALLRSPEIAQVLVKLNVQIEKKLIAIRNDRNLHLDVGLQKVIMELLLSYNPLWLRIGLEAIYGLVLPLKSNSDIEGLTSFIIQRMFKNPFLKNKHSKSSAPNMLLPAYMDAIKKFTLRKFFMLVFFLDQAKQKKLISHDPCLFCRNAICKESREIIIRFTRELIAGIGDITKHLRPLGYVVCHKQSYLDEYKYAVHNLATDIRDGVRLTKVMEIILMKNGLLNQLRTPAISRLQKIHNVQVALNSLKEANFVIVGDINANDIADGHREKTLSLLWQLIHVFRAPLFERAANVIQIWWRKKYEVIVAKRKEEERIIYERNNSASLIQCWWRRIQYNRLVERKMQQVVAGTITLQKYCRMWLCRTRFRRYKASVLTIENWYSSIKIISQAKETLRKLKLEKEELKKKSAIILQSHIRRWICMREYRTKLKHIVTIQSMVRGYIARAQFSRFRNSIMYLQRKYRNKLLMKKDMRNFAETRKAVVFIQSTYKMIKQHRAFQKLKQSVRIIENRYLALLHMREQRKTYIEFKNSVILLQSLYRGRTCRLQYNKYRNQIIFLQRKIRANLLMKKQKADYIKQKEAIIKIQQYIRAYLAMKQVRTSYLLQCKAALVIQRYIRSYLKMKSERKRYIQMRSAAIYIQTYYRNLLKLRKERTSFMNLKNATLCLQRRYRAQRSKKVCEEKYKRIRTAALVIQRQFRARQLMLLERSKYSQIRSSCIRIQNAFRALLLGRQQRKDFLKKREAALTIQTWIRSCRRGKQVKQEFQQKRQACITIQRIYKAFIIGRKERQEYVKIRTATIRIQNYYRAYVEMKTVRQQYIQLKTSTVTIQRFYRSHLETKKQRLSYLTFKSAAVIIQKYYRQYKESKLIRQKYCALRVAAICIQRQYRALCNMRRDRDQYQKLRIGTIVLQQKYRALLAMRTQRATYLQLRLAAIVLQNRFKALLLMKQERNKYAALRNACIKIQTYYRAYSNGIKQRETYSKMKLSAIVIQQRYRALLMMRKQRQIYLNIHSSVVIIQRRYRAHCMMLQERSKYKRILKACTTIQRVFRAYLLGKEQKLNYLKLKSTVITIQRRYRLIKEMRRIRFEYLKLKNIVVFVQHRFRSNKIAREMRQKQAAVVIQGWYRAHQLRITSRTEYLKIRTSIITIQSTLRGFIARKKYLKMRQAVSTIQKYYRSRKLALETRQQYIKDRNLIIKLQAYFRSFVARRNFNEIRKAVVTIQRAYRVKRERNIAKTKREMAAICIQSNFKRYIARSRYLQLRNKVVFIQKLWRGKLVTRLLRCEFFQKRQGIIKLQAIIRGYLVRRQVLLKREQLEKIREEKRRNWAAAKIQAHYRGYKTRCNYASDLRVVEWRRRWRLGAMQSTQQSLKERNEDAMAVLRNMADIETVIRAFRSLELLTEVFPMMYHDNASSIVKRVYIYMSVTNRSISSIEVLKSAASMLVNLTRYRITGPKIYARDRVPPILKFMWRFSNSEAQLFCILCTYLWLFAKYDDVRKDLTEFLHIPENHKMLVTIKSNVDRTKRMATNARNRYSTPQPSKFVSHTNQSLNYSMCSNGNSCHLPLPALEPDYGITRADKPRYFDDAQHAISSLFSAFKL
ncbi:protein abnormal spindle [Amyelois transitella]|uniref:protein abnormal spindle n=1 Tax=Amyelois transitella TaxID=680683 RepID=UPI00067B2596|nr:protein abnormal spindle [Amyelois transitella]